MHISCAFSSPSFNSGIFLQHKCHSAAPTIPVEPFRCLYPSKKTRDTAGIQGLVSGRTWHSTASRRFGSACERSIEYKIPAEHYSWEHPRTGDKVSYTWSMFCTQAWKPLLYMPHLCYGGGCERSTRQGGKKEPVLEGIRG